MTILANSIPTGTTNVYQVPAEKRCTLRVIFTTAEDDTVFVYAVPSGGSFSASNAIVLGYPIKAGDWDASVEVILDEGDVIAVGSGSNTVTFHVNGVEEFLKLRSG